MAIHQDFATKLTYSFPLTLWSSTLNPNGAWILEFIKRGNDLSYASCIVVVFIGSNFYFGCGIVGFCHFDKSEYGDDETPCITINVAETFYHFERLGTDEITARAKCLTLTKRYIDKI